MNNDLISIIVPIYNVEKYLKKCVESICNQTYQNLEIILVDDGSPDKCGEICDGYAKADKRIKVIHKKNGGLSSARNAGLDIAKGEYISFIDSDDYIASDFIEKLYLLCIKNDADIAECGFTKFQDKIKIEKLDEDIKIYTSKEMQTRMYSNNYVGTTVVWNKLYKKYIYNDLRFPIGKINEDEFCTYKALYNCNKNIVVTNKALYYYRYNPSSIMGKKFDLKRLDALEAFDERKRFYEERNEAELYMETLKKYGELLRYYYGVIKENIDESEDILRKLYNNVKDNYKELKKCKNVSIGCKIKNLVFIIHPNIYLCLKNINVFRRLVGVPELENNLTFG